MDRIMFNPYYPTFTRSDVKHRMSEDGQCSCGNDETYEADAKGRLDASTYGEIDCHQICAACGSVYANNGWKEGEPWNDAVARYYVRSPEWLSDLHAYRVALYQDDWQTPGRTVRTAADLEALPPSTVLLAFNGEDTPTVLHANALRDRTWTVPGLAAEYTSEDVEWMLPARIVWAHEQTVRHAAN